MVCLSFTAIFTSVVVAVLETVGIIMCCRLSDKIGTSLRQGPKSLIENIKKLGDTMAKIKAMGPSEEISSWISEVEQILEEARLVLLPESESSSDIDDQQSCCCLGYYEPLPCGLVRKVEDLIVRGEGIVEASNTGEEAETTGEQIRPPIEVSSIGSLDHEIVQLFPPRGEGSSKDEKWKQTVDYEDYGRDLEHETSKREVEHIDGAVDIEDYQNIKLTLHNVEAMLGDNGIRKIGIWGPGGVGKTTLLHALREKLRFTSSSSLNFSSVIFVRVVDVNSTREAIAAKLKLNMKEGMDTKEAANQIHHELQKKKFLLILDDVWESFDLSRIGIPENQPGSKIVLTTRSLEVCNTMEAEAIKMNYLNDVEAWQLFSEQVGGAVDAQGIKHLAENVCKECGGLPLALVCVGSSMRGETRISQWQNAAERLQNSIPPSDSVLPVYNSLKLSYDWLKDDNLKSCFLYCSLFPKGSSLSSESFLAKASPVKIRELVECWLAENLIDSNLDYVVAVSKGMELIEKLKNCSLLEVVGEGWDGGVVMNAMVAKFARWIGQSKGISLVISGYGNSKSTDVILPEEVDSLKWISFVEKKKKKLNENMRGFPSATTLIVGNFIKREVLQKFLQGLEALRVLHTKNIRQFPVSPLKLNSAELRALFFPRGDVAEEKIGELAYAQNLIIVDISASNVRKLPREMEQFTNLKVLNLSSTRYLDSIDLDTLCALEKLEVLDTRGSSHRWSTGKRDGRSATLLDLSRLSRLKAVYVELADVIGNYKDFKWIEGLESSLFYYVRNLKSSPFYPGRELKSSLFYSGREELPNVQMGKKIICIRSACTAEIGSFILHAEHLHLICCHVDEGLFEFPTSEVFISKLKSLHLEDVGPFNKPTETALNSSILSNVEELQVSFDLTRIWRRIVVVYFLRNYFPELRSLVVVGRIGYKDVDIQHTRLRKLERITVRQFKDAEELFQCDTAEKPAAFPNLKILELEDLQRLRSLSDYEWNDQWNRLKTLTVIRCPELKKLPRLSFIEEIRGEVEWWNSLEWDDEETRSFMNQHFKPLQIQPPSERWRHRRGVGTT